MSQPTKTVTTVPDERRRFVVPADLDNERVDRIVAVLLETSRATARGVVDAGEVEIDGRPVDAKNRIPAGTELLVVPAPPPPPIEAAPIASSWSTSPPGSWSTPAPATATTPSQVA